jgi:DNA-binding MarR family transcriptional regulator
LGEDEFRDMATRLHAASIRLLRTLRREDDGSGLSAPRLSALSVIAFAGPLSLAELAAAEQVRAPTMSRLVDALLEAGLVTRETVAEDRRSVRIAVTEAGRRLMEAGRERRVKALLDRLRKISDSEKRALARGVQILEQVLR